MSLKAVFVRFVSHEMRTPLNTMLMGLELLKRDLIERQCDHIVTTTFIHEISVSCQYAVNIVEELLDYDKIIAGVLTLDRTLISVASFLSEIMAPLHIQVLIAVPLLLTPSIPNNVVYLTLHRYTVG